MGNMVAKFEEQKRSDMDAKRDDLKAKIPAATFYNDVNSVLTFATVCEPSLIRLATV